ncbi:MAG: polyprenyl synthetase family protein, partial [Pyrinomonadaceae bacterium]
AAEATQPTTLHKAIRWSLFGGGKRFRPALLLAVGQTFAAAPETLLASACALEMIHAYSLIHDDLPSMDNDDLRRGRPTCHIRFGEATAILAGDALQILAFQTIAEDNCISFANRLRLLSVLAQAAGTPHGIVAGQAYDLEAESTQVVADDLRRIHRLKTGALISAAACCGAIIADASESDLDAVAEFAEHLGLLFQITDDLLDVTATAETLGKTPGKDVRSKKATYALHFGVDVAYKHAVEVHNHACVALERVQCPTSLLRAIAHFILQRTS